MWSTMVKWIYLGVVMAAGAVFGSLFFQLLPVEQQSSLSNEITLYLSWVQKSGDWNNAHLYWSIFFKYMIWTGMLFILGITVIGVPFIIILNFIKGFLIGATLHAMIIAVGSKGIVLSLLSILPHNLIVIPALLILSSAAIGFSAFIVRNRLIRFQGNLREQFMSYSTVAMSMLLLLAIASWIEVNVSPRLLVWYMDQYFVM